MRCSRMLPILIATATLVVPVHSQERPAEVPESYILVWADEFDRSGLRNGANWQFDREADRTGWYKNELQYYSADRLRNAAVDNGQLTITARHEALRDAPDYGGQHYTSARLITRDKAEWRYGFFEVRAKLPCGPGTWSAIWMLGTGAPWPDGGEMDIMEQVGNDPTPSSAPFIPRLLLAPVAMVAALSFPQPAAPFMSISSNGPLTR